MRLREDACMQPVTVASATVAAAMLYMIHSGAMLAVVVARTAAVTPFVYDLNAVHDDMKARDKEVAWTRRPA